MFAKDAVNTKQKTTDLKQIIFLVSGLLEKLAFHKHLSSLQKIWKFCAIRATLNPTYKKAVTSIHTSHGYYLVSTWK